MSAEIAHVSLISNVPPFKLSAPAKVPASERINDLDAAIELPLETVNVLPDAIAIVELEELVSVLIVPDALISKLELSVPLMETLLIVPAAVNFKIDASLLSTMLLELVIVPSPAMVKLLAPILMADPL